MEEGPAGPSFYSQRMVITTTGTFDTSGAVTAVNLGGDGSNGRIRVDGVPVGGAVIAGTTTGVASEFIGPAITDVTASDVIGTGSANANIQVHLEQWCHYINNL